MNKASFAVDTGSASGKSRLMGKKQEHGGYLGGLNGCLAACGLIIFFVLWLLGMYIHYDENWNTPDLEGIFPVIVVPAILVLALVIESRFILNFMRRACDLPTVHPVGHED